MVSSEDVNKQLEAAKNYAKLGQLERALETYGDIPEDIIVPDILDELVRLYSTKGRRTHFGLCLITNYICSKFGVPKA